MFLNKVCLVTGGARGIGKAIVDKFVQQGAKVMVCDKVVDKNIDSTNVNYIECDVSDRESFKNAFLATEQKLGKVNVLVNNAGILREHNYEDIVRINLMGTMYGTQLALKHMSKGDLVINVASLGGLTPTPTTPAYGASKAAVVAYTRNYGSELYFSRFGIRFVCICPSFTRTSMADVSQWNTEDKVIGEILHQFFLKTKELDKLMTPEDLANDLAEILPTAENGSVWIIKKGTKPQFVPAAKYEF